MESDGQKGETSINAIRDRPTYARTMKLRAAIDTTVMLWNFVDGNLNDKKWLFRCCTVSDKLKLVDA